MADRIRVLIVDDERVSALYLRKILDLQGYETKVVNDSRNALEELRLFLVRLMQERERRAHAPRAVLLLGPEVQLV